MGEDLNHKWERITSINNIIDSFFPSRQRRGFITAIGGMDSEDRKRIDENTDKLRKNEEELKNSIGHQTTTIDAMYKFLDNSVLHIDTNLRNIMGKFNSLQTLVNENSKFMNSIHNIVNMEIELIEIGFKIHSITNTIKEQQATILKTLMREESHGVQWLFDLLGPVSLIKIIEKASINLPKELIFPKNRHDGPIMDIFSLIKLEITPSNKQTMVIALKIPLVLKQKFIAKKGKFIPQVNGTIIMSINIAKDIIIQERRIPNLTRRIR